MFCESYRRALMDAATSTEPFASGLAAHLAACQACCAAFAEDRQLFSRIRESLDVTVNAPAPPLMIQRIQAAISQEKPAQRRSPWRWALVPASTVLCAVSMILFFHRSSPKEDPRSNLALMPQKIAPTPGREQVFTEAHAKPEGLSPANRKLKSVFRPADSRAEPRVQVDPAAQTAMEKLLALSRRDPEIAQSFSAKPDSAALEIKPIEVASIDLEPLFPRDGAKSWDEPNR